MGSGCLVAQASCSAGSLPAWLPEAVFLQQMGGKQGRWQPCTPTTGLFKSCFHSCDVPCVPRVIRAARSSR